MLLLSAKPVLSKSAFKTPVFQGQLWINHTRNPQAMQERLQTRLSQWTQSIHEQNTVAGMEEEIVQEERSWANLPELQALLKRVYSALGRDPQTIPVLIPNKAGNQVVLDYGEDTAFRVALGKALKAEGVLYFDTEKAFLCNLNIEPYKPKDPFAHLAGRVGKLLLDLKKTITTAESCTGGLIASRLTDVKASGTFLKCADVVYCNEAKREALGVSKIFLDEYGPYNAETAKRMAEGSMNRLGADVAVSITGLAGLYPEGNVPAGTAFVGIAGLTPETQVFQVTLPSDLPKERKKLLFSEFALAKLEALLKALKK
jgi:PncC family amidohydrolase